MDFALKRLRKHLTDHYRKYGDEGGIYQFDFKNYFGSLPHDELKKRARRVLMDDRLYHLACEYIDDFLKMGKADPSLHRGVGLGSEVSQIFSLDYANPIDHYVKDVRRIHGYGRYMDDGYVISHSLEELRDIKRALYRLAGDIGLTMSDKKNIITPFKNHSFTFLKIRFSFGKNGRIVMKLGRASIKSIRRKLDIFRKWIDAGNFGPEDAFTAYQSWRAHAQRCDSYRTLHAMDVRFVRLFARELRVRDKPFPCTLAAVMTDNGWSYFERGHKEEKECDTSRTGITTGRELETGPSPSPPERRLKP